MNIKELSLKLAAIKLIEDEAKAAKAKVKAEIEAEMAEVGADRIKAELNEETIAYIISTHPKPKLEITNMPKFVKWVKDNYPSEIVEWVREYSIEILLDKFRQTDGLIVDPNGELVDFVAFSEPQSYLTTKFHSDGREKLREALVSNSIEPKKVLELE